MKISQWKVATPLALAVVAFFSPALSFAEIKDTPHYLLYIPPQAAESKRPLVIVLSPVGDAEVALRPWEFSAQKYGWFVLATRDFRNGATNWLDPLESSLKEVIANYPVDTDRIITSGFSGGGMGAHVYAVERPQQVRAVVINSGAIHPDYLRKLNNPGDKLVVFLVGRLEPAYQLIRKDYVSLTQQGWKTLWIVYEDDHEMAPSQIYGMAAKWINEQW